jgi:NAD(P)-dependent dehydrogenase (short-subunit alcohol dehydrogenase family)
LIVPPNSVSSWPDGNSLLIPASLAHEVEKMFLAQKSVVVIGGSSGMGLATAKAALAEGADVTVTGRTQAWLDTVRAESEGRIRTVAVDAGDEAAMRSFLGDFARIDHIYVTAAALLYGPKLDPDSSALRAAMDTRFWGCFYTAKYAAPKMPPDGSITFTTGTATRKPMPSGSVVTASCGAVEAFARGLAVDLAPIRVNAIAPGLIATPLHERRGGKEAAAKRLEQMAARLPLKRAGRPEEVADAVLFLMKNQFVTGITLTVDGGGLLV